MPLLSYSSSNFPFTPFTKIYSADVNACFNDIKTLLNTTMLDDTNLQNAGITLTTKGKTTGASAGNVLGYNGSALAWVSSSLGQMFNVVFGSAAQVTAGVATHSAVASWTQADGDRVLVLPGYNESAAWSISKKVYVQGFGDLSQITGTLTMTNTADYSTVRTLRITDNVTLNSGADGIIISDVFLASGKSFTDNGDGNLLTAVQES